MDVIAASLDMGHIYLLLRLSLVPAREFHVQSTLIWITYFHRTSAMIGWPHDAIGEIERCNNGGEAGQEWEETGTT